MTKQPAINVWLQRLRLHQSYDYDGFSMYSETCMGSTSVVLLYGLVGFIVSFICGSLYAGSITYSKPWDL